MGINLSEINLYRKLFHIFWGLFLFFLSSHLSFFNFSLFLIIIFSFLIIFEILRIFKPHLLPLKFLWKPLLKKEEKNKLNDACFFMAGVIISWFLLDLDRFKLVLLILTFSDPFACFSGFLIGKRKLWNNKTLEGSLSFLLITLTLSIFYTKCFNFSIFLFSLLLTFTEAFTKRDNFWIPVIGSLYLRVFI